MSARVRPATTSDAAAIVALVRDGFDAATCDLMIYGCHGAERFVAEQIAGADLADTRYLVAEAADRVVGCIELRCLTEALVLNYVCIAAEARRAHLGSRLLSAAIAATRRPNHLRMILDVFEDNLPARRWYEGLGFTRQHATAWWCLPRPDATGAPSGVIAGLPQGRVGLAAYGFSQISVITERGTYAVGLLGDRWFRVTEASILADREALVALARLDPARRIFAILPTGATDLPADADLHRTSVRMAIGLDQLGGTP